MTFNHTCSFCQKVFSRTGTRNSTKTYCSTECYHNSRRTRPPVVCQHCGQTFQLKSGQNGQTRQYCTWSCYLASHTAPLVIKTCPVCAESFSVPASRAHRYTVCSLACSTKKPIEHICPKCHAHFTGPKRRRFCSIACRQHYHGENALEQRIRECLDAMCLKASYIQESALGRYAVDFDFPEHAIALEIDGSYWHRDKRRDHKKDAFLQRVGYTVIRIPEKDITDCKDDETLALLLSARLSAISPTVTTPLLTYP